MTQTTNYMKKRKISKNLQNRVRKYLTYIWDSNLSGGFHLVFENLSAHLKNEFTTEVIIEEYQFRLMLCS
jgi:hypothetical protein